MPTIPLDLPHHSYAVTVEPGALTRLADIVREAVPSADRGFAGDRRRAWSRTTGARWRRRCRTGGIDTAVAVIPVSEKKKTLGTVRNLYEILLENKLERGHALVTLGGGICCDVAGFAAATYLRGIAVVQCPTTLLAMVDASVGGKTGVNVPQGKNLIGAFHQPAAVVCDPVGAGDAARARTAVRDGGVHQARGDPRSRRCLIGLPRVNAPADSRPSTRRRWWN